MTLTTCPKLSALLVTMTLVIPGVLSGCGGSSNQSDAAAVEARIERERADAAKAARQEERIRQLEREAAEAPKKRPVRTATAEAPTAAPPTPVPAARPTVTAEPATSGDWPGGSGQTVILASEASQGAARTIQQRATSAGLDAGVLRSSDYSSLRAGYWVVFSGKFDTTNSASQRQARARSLGFGDAYVRFVAP